VTINLRYAVNRLHTNGRPDDCQRHAERSNQQRRAAIHLDCGLFTPTVGVNDPQRDYPRQAVIADLAGNACNRPTNSGTTTHRIAPCCRQRTIVVRYNALKIGDTSLVTITFTRQSPVPNSYLTIANGNLERVAAVTAGFLDRNVYPTTSITDATEPDHL